jgi:long-chain acyl-CoA synthetase
MADDTIPKLFKNACTRGWDKKVAIRQKDLGIWKTYTWKYFYETVKHFSLGLVSLGLERGDRVCIIGNNEPQWFYAQFATMCAGGVFTGNYADSRPNEIEFVINHSGSKFVVLEDQEQVDKFLEVKDICPKVVKAIFWDPKGLKFYDDPILMTFEEVLQLGVEYERQHPGFFEQSIEMSHAEDPVYIGYTSGTTGLPKGGMHNSRSLLSCARAYCAFEPASESDNYLCFTPLCYDADLIYQTLPALEVGATTNFPEEPATIEENAREIGQGKAISNPRWLQVQLSMVQVKMADSNQFKRLLYQLFMPVGYKMADFDIRHKKPSIFWKTLNALGYVALFRSLKDWLAYSKVRSVYVGGAAISSEMFLFYRAIGVDIRNLYGLTEFTPATMHPKDDIDPETTGIITPGTTIRISDKGEVWLRGPLRFMEYYSDPEQTGKAIDDAGWFHTGDAGFFDEKGHLVIYDRVSDLGALDDGAVFSPMYIENKLKFSPYIKDAIILGDDKPFTAALISMDFANQGNWAENHRIPFTTFADLSQKQEVYDLIRNELIKANQRLPERQQLKRYALLPKELDADDAELTRTFKLRRGYVSRLYSGFVDALYSNDTEYLAETEVKYRDGKTAKVKTAVKIGRLE